MQYETEMYHAPSAAPQMPDDSRLGVAFQILTWIVLGTLMLVWAVVGFVFWLPRMLREMAAFSLALVYATMTGADLSPAGDRLKEAIQFYRRGFELAHASVLKSEPPSSVRKAIAVNPRILAKEAVWAVLVWWVLLSLVGAIELTPLAVVRWFTSGAWLAAFDRMMVAFWGLLDRITGAAGG